MDQDVVDETLLHHFAVPKIILVRRVKVIVRKMLTVWERLCVATTTARHSAHFFMKRMTVVSSQSSVKLIQKECFHFWNPSQDKDVPGVTFKEGDAAHQKILAMRVKEIVMDQMMVEVMMAIQGARETLCAAVTTVRSLVYFTTKKTTVARNPNPVLSNGHHRKFFQGLF